MKKEYLRSVFLVVGVLFLLSGFCLTFFSASGVTGYSVSNGESQLMDGFLGIFLFFTGIFLIKKSRKKGQAAIEFLMTYGWAILAAVLSLGMLTYFGVFSGDFGSTATVAFSPPFYSEASNLQELLDPADGETVIGHRIGIELFKGGDSSFKLVSISARSKDGLVTCEYVPQGGLAIKAAEKKALYLNCLQEINTKNFEGEVIINYIAYGSSLTQTATGTIKGKFVSVESFCGDGSVVGEEICEISGVQECVAAGGYSGSQLCAPDCLSYGVCTTTESCGDGTVNGNEDCELESFVSKVCEVEGGVPGTQSCVDCAIICEPDGGDGGDGGEKPL